MASDGIRLAYYVDDFSDPWRSAPTLLLLHAAMGSSRRYYAWVPWLSRHYRVVRMDCAATGTRRCRLVADVAELLDHLDCRSAYIIGNLAGGYLGQQLAMTRAERVRSLDAVRLHPRAQTQPGAELDPKRPDHKFVYTVSGIELSDEQKTKIWEEIAAVLTV
jgi:3-oxoadipate enol-lactonase